ncbi:unnamed protein product [Fusarium graminearum]|nr:unnamed protein product [Fusarium graminearum]
MTLLFKETLEAFQSSGAALLRDREIGKELGGFDFVINTPAGLDFIAKHTVTDQEIRSILYTVLPEPCLAYVKVYGDKLPSDCAFFFHSGHPSTLSLVVQLWSSNSTAVIYETSHLQSVKPHFDKEISSEKGLLAVHDDKLRMLGIPGKEVTMNEGGM